MGDSEKGLLLSIGTGIVATIGEMKCNKILESNHLSGAENHSLGSNNDHDRNERIWVWGKYLL